MSPRREVTFLQRFAGMSSWQSSLCGSWTCRETRSFSLGGQRVLSLSPGVEFHKGEHSSPFIHCAGHPVGPSGPETQSWLLGNLLGCFLAHFLPSDFSGTLITQVMWDLAVFPTFLSFSPLLSFFSSFLSFYLSLSPPALLLLPSFLPSPKDIFTKSRKKRERETHRCERTQPTAWVCALTGESSLQQCSAQDDASTN